MNVFSFAQDKKLIKLVTICYNKYFSITVSVDFMNSLCLTIIQNTKK